MFGPKDEDVFTEEDFMEDMKYDAHDDEMAKDDWQEDETRY